MKATNWYKVKVIGSNGKVKFMIWCKQISGCRSRTVCRIELKLDIHVKYNIVNVLYQGHVITGQGQTRLSVINERFWL